MKHPGRFLIWGAVLSVPVVLVTGWLESALRLSAGATFALLMTLGMAMCFAVLRAVEGPLFTPPPRDREER